MRVWQQQWNPRMSPCQPQSIIISFQLWSGHLILLCCLPAPPLLTHLLSQLHTQLWWCPSLQYLLRHLNRPSGGKEYLCHLCTFRHSNLDCILSHIRKHLNIMISYPVCGTGYQNAASLHKHGRYVHNGPIVALADVIPTEEY